MPIMRYVLHILLSVHDRRPCALAILVHRLPSVYRLPSSVGRRASSVPLLQSTVSISSRPRYRIVACYFFVLLLSFSVSVLP